MIRMVQWIFLLNGQPHRWPTSSLRNLGTQCAQCGLQPEYSQYEECLSHVHQTLLKPVCGVCSELHVEEKVCSLCSETEWDSNIMNSKQVWESPETAVSPYLNESRKGSFLNVGAGTVCLTLYQQATVSYCVRSEWSSMLPCVHCECVCVSASFRMRTEQTKAQSLTLIFGAESLCCIAQSRSF